MTKKTRLIILLSCALLFFVITPYIILYSLGYRVDVKKFKVVATGGIYVKASPQGVTISIDHKTGNTTGIFSNTVFVQNLLPQNHSILITKDGYYDYQKNLDVKENEVTKLEHVMLFKKNIIFEAVADPKKSPFNTPLLQDSYIIKNNHLYLNENLAASQNPSVNLPDSTQATTPIIKSIITYKVQDNHIIWLGQDGFLHRSDLQGKNTEILNKTKLIIDQKSLYELLVLDGNIFLKENSGVLLFDTSKKDFTNFYNPVTDLKISPDGQKILFYNDHEILYSPTNSLGQDTIFLNRFSEKINDCYWVGSDYIVFDLAGKIIISEIDVRGNINSIELPQTLSLINGSTITLQNPNIYFDEQEKKLYILTGKTVLVSEKLTP